MAINQGKRPGDPAVSWRPLLMTFAA